MAKKLQAVKKPAPVKKVRNKQTEIKTIIQKTMQNTITISGADLLELFEDAGLIFDKTGTIKLSTNTRSGRGRYSYSSTKTVNINPTSNYNITCSKKSNSEETNVIKKPKSKYSETEELDVVELL